MSVTRMACIALAGALLAPPMPVNASNIYRWVDAAGVTTYGNKPPANARKLRRLRKEGRISVIPSPPAVVGARPGAEKAPDAERAANRVPSAEVGQASVASAARERDWIKRCRAEYRVDCSDPTAATYDSVPALAPHDSPADLRP